MAKWNLDRICVQGPRDEDVFYRDEPGDTYTVEFRINGTVVYTEQFDYNPTREIMERIFNTKVKPDYPGSELL